MRALQRLAAGIVGIAVAAGPAIAAEQAGAAGDEPAGASAAAAAPPPPGRVRIDGALYAFALDADAPAFMREQLLPQTLTGCQARGRELFELASSEAPDRRKLYGAFGAVAFTCTNPVTMMVDKPGRDAFDALIEEVRDDLFVYTGEEPGGAAALTRAVARMAEAGFDHAILAVNPDDLPH
jgi:hypothetical protein